MIIARIIDDATAELERASKWPEFNSAHEGFAVLKEEVDELWEHVKVNQKKRDLDAMRAGAIQVAAMAMKFVQMIDAGHGRVWTAKPWGWTIARLRRSSL